MRWVMPNFIRHKNLIVNLDMLVCITIDNNEIVIVLSGAEKIEIHRFPDNLQEDLSSLWNCIQNKMG